jgi:hypothetical protein
VASEASYVAAVAAAAECSVDQISIVSIVEYAISGRRQLSSLLVNTKITARTSAQSQIFSSGQVTKAALDQSLKAFGLPDSLKLTVSTGDPPLTQASTPEETLANAGSAAATGTQTSSTSSNGFGVGTIAGVAVAGGVVAGLAGFFCLRRRYSARPEKGATTWPEMQEAGTTFVPLPAATQPASTRWQSPTTVRPPMDHHPCAIAATSSSQHTDIVWPELQGR